MAEYVFVPTGATVESDSALTGSLFRRVRQKAAKAGGAGKAAQGPKAAARRKASREG